MVSSLKPVPIFSGRGSKKFNRNVGLFSFKIVLFNDRMVSSLKPVTIFSGRGSKKSNISVELFSFKILLKLNDKYGF
jgi:hypothetical protein